jgi:hypothetical protein
MGFVGVMRSPSSDGLESFFPNQAPCHIGGGVGGEREFHDNASTGDAQPGFTENENRLK